MHTVPKQRMAVRVADLILSSPVTTPRTSSRPHRASLQSPELPSLSQPTPKKKRPASSAGRQPVAKRDKPHGVLQGWVVHLSKLESEDEQARLVRSLALLGADVVDDVQDLVDQLQEQAAGLTQARVAVLAKECRRSRRFLVALAAGIPCLSLAWLDAVAKSSGGPLPEQQPYLLPVSTHLQPTTTSTGPSWLYKEDRTWQPQVSPTSNQPVFAGMHFGLAVSDASEMRAMLTQCLIAARGTVVDLPVALRQSDQAVWVVVPSKHREELPNNLRRELKHVQLVTHEWVVQCLLVNQRLEPTLHSSFHPH